MVRNKLCWAANCTVGLWILRQRNSYQSSPIFLCFESLTAYLHFSIIYSVTCDRTVQRAYFCGGAVLYRGPFFCRRRVYCGRQVLHEHQVLCRCQVWCEYRVSYGHHIFRTSGLVWRLSFVRTSNFVRSSSFLRTCSSWDVTQLQAQKLDIFVLCVDKTRRVTVDWSVLQFNRNKSFYLYTGFPL